MSQSPASAASSNPHTKRTLQLLIVALFAAVTLTACQGGKDGSSFHKGVRDDSLRGGVANQF